MIRQAANPSHARRNATGHGLVVIGAIALISLGGFTSWATAQPTVGDDIAESKIASLEKDLATAKASDESLVARRRQFKRIVRRGEALIEASPTAANRFVVLDIMFQSQKRLLAMDNSARNRRTLFEISGELAEAPDRYAEIRLEADLMLSEKQLSENNATLTQRAEALAKLIERYRGTTGEAKSLLMGALIAQKLDAPELEDAIQYALDENFSDDAEVIEFRRKYLRISRLDVTFRGAFERADGVTLRFPADTAGHLSLNIFWSKNKPATDAYLDQIAEALKSRSEPIDVFSFNLDGLPDAGQSLLREKGLDWCAMKLPGGRNHQAYRTYAQGDPVAVLVNEYGLAVVRPEIVHGRQFALDTARISEPRYIAQLQWLFVGEFLVADSVMSRDLPADDPLAAVQDCFVPPPYRYRLTPEQALSNYRKAAKLCREAIDERPHSEDLWRLRDRRLIALLGIWNMACEPGSLAKAVDEATAALATDPPLSAQIVPRFCLAKDQLRRGQGDPETIVSEYLKQTGGEDASARALAAACVLALDAKSRELHDTYRSRFIEQHGSDPRFYAFTSFLRERYHRYRLLKANHNRRERSTRGYIVNHGGEPTRDPFPKIVLKTLDGGTFELPGGEQDKMTLLLFVEPPEDDQADFPVRLNRQGKPTDDDSIRRLVSFADHLAEQHVNKSLQVIVAFICDDAKRVADLMVRNEWAGQALMVPGGLNNPMVRQLGILSADKVPNVFLLRRDGTVAWWASGLEYKGEFGFPFAFQLGMKVHIETSEVEYGYRALARGEFEKAARVFAGPFKPERPDRFGWRSPRYHGQALAQMGLNDYPAALEAIDIAIDAHRLRHYRGRGPRDITKWREYVAEFKMKEPCDVLALLWTTKARILDAAGKSQQAEEVRKQAEQAVVTDRPDVYHAFHEKLSKLKTGE